MPFTQTFDQFFTIVVVLGIAIYLLRTALGVSLLVVGALPSKLGASARAAGQRITPRLVMKIITTATGLLVAATGIGASTALATPASVSSTSASSQPGDAEYYDFDDLEDLIAIDRGPSIDDDALEYDDDVPEFDDELPNNAESATNIDSEIQPVEDVSSGSSPGNEPSSSTPGHKEKKSQTGKTPKSSTAKTKDRQGQ